jgi:hypothetical protein
MHLLQTYTHISDFTALSETCRHLHTSTKQLKETNYLKKYAHFFLYLFIYYIHHYNRIELPTNFKVFSPRNVKVFDLMSIPPSATQVIFHTNFAEPVSAKNLPPLLPALRLVTTFSSQLIFFHPPLRI